MAGMTLSVTQLGKNLGICCFYAQNIVPEFFLFAEYALYCFQFFLVIAQDYFITFFIFVLPFWVFLNKLINYRRILQAICNSSLE